VMALKDNGDEG